MMEMRGRLRRGEGQIREGRKRGIGEGKGRGGKGKEPPPFTMSVYGPV